LGKPVRDRHQRKAQSSFSIFVSSAFLIAFRFGKPFSVRFSRQHPIIAEFCGERLTRRERFILSWFLFPLFFFLKGSD
jgi:hypothetical protein